MGTIPFAGWSAACRASQARVPASLRQGRQPSLLGPFFSPAWSLSPLAPARAAGAGDECLRRMRASPSAERSQGRQTTDPLPCACRRGAALPAGRRDSLPLAGFSATEGVFGRMPRDAAPTAAARLGRSRIAACSRSLRRPRLSAEACRHAARRCAPPQGPVGPSIARACRIPRRSPVQAIRSRSPCRGIPRRDG